MIVLDTDIVTLLSYGKTEKLRQRMERESDDFAVTIITRMEILQGRFDSIRKAEDGGKLQLAMERFHASERLLDAFVRLDADALGGEHFERVRRSKKSKKMRRGDMLIACITLAHNALLVTRNLKDYEGIPELRLENWAD